MTPHRARKDMMVLCTIKGSIASSKKPGYQRWRRVEEPVYLSVGTTATLNSRTWSWNRV